MAFFSLMNDVSQVLSQTNFTSFLRRAFRGLANYAKFGINLRTKFIFPKKDIAGKQHYGAQQ